MKEEGREEEKKSATPKLRAAVGPLGTHHSSANSRSQRKFCNQVNVSPSYRLPFDTPSLK